MNNFFPVLLNNEEAPIEYSEAKERVDSVSVVIKPEILDLSALQKGCGKSFWRPENFDQYIGQKSLKEILNGYVRGCKEMNKTFPHLLIDGKAGTGKTTIAYILAKQLNVPFVECVANSLKSTQQFVDLLVRANGGIVYLDELQVISKQLANAILPMIEDFQINGQAIKPFTLFSTTTEKGILIKKWKPLIDRFKIQKTLDPYSLDELAILIRQYKEKNFQKVEIKDEIYSQISMNARLTPRVGIRLLESFIFMSKPLEEVFRAYNIVKLGNTTEDLKVLQLLADNPKGIGLNSICAYLQTSVENYAYAIESYLIEQKFVTIGSRRMITREGLNFLKSL